MSDSSIIATALQKTYDKEKKSAVDGIDLTVKSGEIYGFLGPNGAGKSTTIKMLVTTLFPSGGTMRVLGFDPATESHKIREQIGVVYQNNSLDLNLTSEENLRSHAVLYGLTNFALTFKSASKNYQKRVNELMQLVGLKERMFELVRNYSGGMRRKLDIAKALLHRPKILFLDEPTTGVDPQSRRTIWDYLLTLQKQEKFTLFLTTQYLEEADVCHRISIIDKGQILVTDTPDNLKKSVGAEMLYVKPRFKQKLEAELYKKKIEFQTDVKGNYIIKLEQRKAQELLQAIETELIEISIKKPTLDDVFIYFTGKDIN